MSYAGQSGKFETESDCHYVFEWRSKMACSQCLESQVHSIEGPCVDNYRFLHQVPFEDALCVMYPQLDFKNDGSLAIMQATNKQSYPFAIEG